MKRQAPLEDSDEILKTAKAHFTSKNYRKAIGFISTLLKRGNGEQCELYNLRARAKLELNDLDGALADARAALKLNRAYTQAYNTAIRILLKQKNTTAAGKLQKKGLDTCDKESRHYATLKELIYVPEKNTRDPATLPVELFEQIILYLPDKEIRKAQLVSHQWSTMIGKNGIFWRTLEFPPLDSRPDKLLKARSRLLQQKSRFVHRLSVALGDFELSFLLSTIQSGCPHLKDLTLRLSGSTSNGGDSKDKIALEMLFRSGIAIEKLCLQNLDQHLLLMVTQMCHKLVNLQDLQLHGGKKVVRNMHGYLFVREESPITLNLRVLVVHFDIGTREDLGLACITLMERSPDLEKLDLDLHAPPPMDRLGLDNVKLREVSFSYMWLTPWQLNNVEHLTLIRCTLDRATDPNFHPGFPVSKKLKTLTMRQIGLAVPQRDADLQLPFSFESLESLQLESCDSEFDAQYMSRIKHAPTPFFNLRHLKWERPPHFFDDDFVDVVAIKFPNLESCKIVQSQKITGVSIRALVQGCKFLKELTIQDCFHVNVDAIYWARSKNVKVNFSRLDTMSRRVTIR